MLVGFHVCTYVCVGACLCVFVSLSVVLYVYLCMYLYGSHLDKIKPFEEKLPGK